jgi:hypothetical protein
MEKRLSAYADKPFSRLVTREGQGVQAECFEVKDRFGRDIGAQVALQRLVFEAVPEVELNRNKYGFPRPNNFRVYLTTPGEYFVFTPSALRAGKMYGAIQSARYCDSIVARDITIRQYFAAARKRAVKNAGK